MSKAMQQKPKLTWTKKYNLFGFSDDNRVLDMARRKDLRHSMEKYGYIAAYPIMCVRKGGKLVVMDGQHRIGAAEELGLAVCYVVCENGMNIADINNTQKTWRPIDYALSHAAKGNDHYIELVAFVNANKIPINLSVALLSGTSTDSANQTQVFRSGDFKVVDRERASRIAVLLNKIGQYSPVNIKTRFLVHALFCCCCVEDFEDKRLLGGAARNPESLLKYGSKDGFLDMLERLYNFGKRTKYPLKINAENAMKQRDPRTRNNA